VCFSPFCADGIPKSRRVDSLALVCKQLNVEYMEESRKVTLHVVHIVFPSSETASIDEDGFISEDVSINKDVFINEEPSVLVDLPLRANRVKISIETSNSTTRWEKPKPFESIHRTRAQGRDIHSCLRYFYRIVFKPENLRLITSVVRKFDRAYSVIFHLDKSACTSYNNQIMTKDVSGELSAMLQDMGHVSVFEFGIFEGSSYLEYMHLSKTRSGNFIDSKTADNVEELYQGMIKRRAEKLRDEQAALAMAKLDVRDT
jgi:hypothetical protein